MSYVDTEAHMRIALFDETEDIVWGGIMFVARAMIVNGDAEIVLFGKLFHVMEGLRFGTADDGGHAGIFGIFECITDFILFVFHVNYATAHEDKSRGLDLIASFVALGRRALHRKMHVL